MQIESNKMLGRGVRMTHPHQRRRSWGGSIKDFHTLQEGGLAVSGHPFQ